MSNTVVWDDPDTVQDKQGQTAPGVMYIVNPATGLVMSIADLSLTVITNDNSFAKESGGNLDAIKADLDAIKAQQGLNTDAVTLIASGAQTATADSADQTNTAHRGAYVYIKTGAFGSGASAITVTIQGKDPGSNVYYDILTSKSLVASKDPSSDAGNILLVYPGATVVANQAVSQPLPKTWRAEARASAWGTSGSTLAVFCGYIA